MAQPSHNTQLVKKINVELVKNALRTSGTGTKASVAGQTRLSVATCGTILNELVQTGEILELGWEESSGGRPARKYQFNADYSSIICMIVRAEGGRQSITCALANLNGEIIEEAVKDYDEITPDTLGEWLDEMIADRLNVQAIGIGIPGVVQQDRIGICDVPALAEQPLGLFLKERYKEVEIIIENDMNLTVYGLYQKLLLDEESHFAVLTFPKNHYPGAGFMVNGRLLNGNSFFSGEVSYLPYGIPEKNSSGCSRVQAIPASWPYMHWCRSSASSTRPPLLSQAIISCRRCWKICAADAWTLFRPNICLSLLFSGIPGKST